MDFCKKCDNMLYMKKNKEKQLIYFCKCCGHEDEQLIHTQNLKVYSFSKTNQNKESHINEYSKYDPTLPHVKTIKCPNTECPSNKDSHLMDVIYMRIDDTNMKYMYLCTNCNYNWLP